MKDRSLRLDLSGRVGRIAVTALAAACLGVVVTASFALTASASKTVNVCIGKAHTVDANELYVKAHCGAGIKHLTWPDRKSVV